MTVRRPARPLFENRSLAQVLQVPEISKKKIDLGKRSNDFETYSMKKNLDSKVVLTVLVIVVMAGGLLLWRSFSAPPQPLADQTDTSTSVSRPPGVPASALIPLPKPTASR